MKFWYSAQVCPAAIWHGAAGQRRFRKRPADQRQILAPDVLLFVYAALSGIMALFLR